MTRLPANEYRVIAHNTAKESENKIHDDAVAQRFGFGGGLVPGVDVYAYMTHPAVQKWGLAWLAQGTGACRFLRPVYDGEEALVTGTRSAEDASLLNIAVESRGELCATGWAALDEEAAVAPAVNDIPAAALPVDRPSATPQSLRPGLVLGTYQTVFDAAGAPGYLGDVREDLALYREEGVAHPGYLLRMANWALTHNVALGPWIHVASQISHFGLVHYGDRLAARAQVLDNYERSGHRFVELDVLVLANDSQVVARYRHTAIYEPRQSRA
jgi:acyl dehydratase